jgi:hypothetical protein
MIKDKVQKNVKKTKRQARREVSFKETLDTLLALELPSEFLPQAIQNSPVGGRLNYREVILLMQILKASGGDTQAAVFLRDTSGNKLKDAEKQQTQNLKFEDF